jgi:hypothetical protein
MYQTQKSVEIYHIGDMIQWEPGNCGEVSIAVEQETEHISKSKQTKKPV